MILVYCTFSPARCRLDNRLFSYPDPTLGREKKITPKSSVFKSYVKLSCHLQLKRTVISYSSVVIYNTNVSVVSTIRGRIWQYPTSDADKQIKIKHYGYLRISCCIPQLLCLYATTVICYATITWSFYVLRVCNSCHQSNAKTKSWAVRVTYDNVKIYSLIL